MVQLFPVGALVDAPPTTDAVHQAIRTTLDLSCVLRQCISVSTDQGHWGIGVGDDHPPIVFTWTAGTVQVLGYAPFFCGPIVRMGVDPEYLHVVIHSPEGDELYYRLSRRDLSFAELRGEVVTHDHREILYATP